MSRPTGFANENRALPLDAVALTTNRRAPYSSTACDLACNTLNLNLLCELTATEMDSVRLLLFGLLSGRLLGPMADDSNAESVCNASYRLDL